MAKGRILAIDDEPFFRDLYRDLLVAEGYHVRTAAGGSEAMEALRQEEFDLVVTDMEMPGMNGIETTEAIRRFHPEQEVMVVTGQRDAAFAVEVMKRGVTEYLLKPINPEEFLLVVGRILFRQSQRREQQQLAEENVEYVSQLTAYRQCLALLPVRDLDRLGDLVLDTLMELLRAEGAVLWLQEQGGRQYRLRCRRGLTRVAEEEELFCPGAEVRRLVLAGEPSLPAGGTILWAPLLAGVEQLALVRVESPVGRSTFGPQDCKVAATVAQFAASTLHNVLHLRRLERDALRVSRGEAYTMAFFRDHAAKELYKARRYGRNLSLVRLRVDNYVELDSRFRNRELEKAMGRLVGTVSAALRDADVMAMSAPNEFHLLLPETDHWGSLVTQKRIRRALRGQLSLCDTKKSLPIRVSMRSASLPGDGVTVEALERAAEGRLERLSGSLMSRGRMEGLPFWGVVGQLLGTTRDYRLDGDTLRVSERLALYEERLRSSYLRMSAGQLDELMCAFCREVVESSRVRGVIYRGCDDFDLARQELRDPEGIEKSATSLYLLGGKRRVTWDFQRIVPIHIDDRNFEQVPFLLYLNEDCAYALFARRAGQELVGFHTADFYFVENMIAKLQEHYQLQAQI